MKLHCEEFMVTCHEDMTVLVGEECSALLVLVNAFCVFFISNVGFVLVYGKWQLFHLFYFVIHFYLMTENDIFGKESKCPTFRADHEPLMFSFDGLV